MLDTKKIDVIEGTVVWDMENKRKGVIDRTAVIKDSCYVRWFNEHGQLEYYAGLVGYDKIEVYTGQDL